MNAQGTVHITRRTGCYRPYREFWRQTYQVSVGQLYTEDYPTLEDALSPRGWPRVGEPKRIRKYQNDNGFWTEE